MQNNNNELNYVMKIDILTRTLIGVFAPTQFVSKEA